VVEVRSRKVQKMKMIGRRCGCSVVRSHYTHPMGLGPRVFVAAFSAHSPWFLPETTHTTVVARVFLQCRVLEGRVVTGDREGGAPESGKGGGVEDSACVRDAEGRSPDVREEEPYLPTPVLSAIFLYPMRMGTDLSAGLNISFSVSSSSGREA